MLVIILFLLDIVANVLKMIELLFELEMIKRGKENVHAVVEEWVEIVSVQTCVGMGVFIVCLGMLLVV